MKKFNAEIEQFEKYKYKIRCFEDYKLQFSFISDSYENGLKTCKEY